MSEIIFHLGWPKTGSTALQAHLAQNAAKLQEAGLYVPPNVHDPLDPSSDKSKALQKFAKGRSHSLILHEITGMNRRHKARGMKERAQMNGSFDNAIAAFEASGCRKMILSSEAMFWASDSIAPRRLPKRLSNFTVRGLAYARRYDLYFTSLFRQNVKAGNITDMTFESFITQRRKARKSGMEKPVNHLQRYREFGIEVTLRSYDHVGRNLISDAMAQFDAPEPLCVPSEIKAAANPSFTDAQSIFVLEMHRRDSRKKRVQKVIEEMRNLNKNNTLSIDLPDVALASADRLADLVAQYNADMQRAADFQGTVFEPHSPGEFHDKRVAETLTDQEWETAVNSLPASLSRMLKG